MTILHTHMLLDDLVRICVKHTNHCNRLNRRNQTFIDRIRTYGRRNISTVRRTIHTRDHDIHLTEGIIHIDARTI